MEKKNNLGQSMKDEKLIAVSLRRRRNVLFQFITAVEIFLMKLYNENYIKEFSFYYLFFFTMIFMKIVGENFSIWLNKI